MVELLSVLSTTSLFSILYFIIIGVVLYIITDKYGYLTNVIIYLVIKILPTFFLLSEITFGVFMLNIIINLLISLIVVYVAQSSRENFEYDTIVWFIIVITITQIIASAVITKIFSLF